MNRQSSAVPANKKNNLQKIALPLNDALVFVPVNDIVYFQAKGSYTEAHIQNVQTYTTGRTIKEFDDLLPDEIFCRIHNSYIINVNHIKKYQKGRAERLKWKMAQ